MLTVSLALFCGVVCAEEAIGGPPEVIGTLSIPKSGNRIDDFVPPGYQVRLKAEADFNGDGLTDLVVVIGSEQDPDSRPLLVLLRRPGGGYTLSARADRAVPPPHTGGTHGDGFNGIEIRKNTFVILQGGGSSTVSTTESQFRFQNGGWFLIGEKTVAAGGVGRECGGVTLKEPDEFYQYTLDTNFLTGDQIQSCWTGDSKEVKRQRKVPRTPLIRLERFGYD